MEDDRRMTHRTAPRNRRCHGSDPHGRQGLVLDKRDAPQRSGGRPHGSTRQSRVTFTLDGGRPLEGSHLQQRAEDRINRKHGRN